MKNRLTKREKILMLIGVVLVIILLFLLRKSPGVTNNPDNISFGNVSIPGVNLGPRPPIILSLPGLPDGSQYDFGAISTCMCDGTLNSTAGNYTGPLVAYNETINEGNSGPYIFNYTNQASTGTNWWSDFAGYS